MKVAMKFIIQCDRLGHACTRNMVVGCSFLRSICEVEIRNGKYVLISNYYVITHRSLISFCCPMFDEVTFVLPAAKLRIIVSYN